MAPRELPWLCGRPHDWGPVVGARSTRLASVFGACEVFVAVPRYCNSARTITSSVTPTTHRHIRFPGTPLPAHIFLCYRAMDTPSIMRSTYVASNELGRQVRSARRGAAIDFSH